MNRIHPRGWCTALALLLLAQWQPTQAQEVPGSTAVLQPDSPAATLPAPAASAPTADLLSATATAQALTYYEEQGELKRGSRSVAALGPDLAGDRIDLYTGAVTLGQIDISLPGNNALPVAWGRRYSLTTHFGGWDPEVPRISGTFATGPAHRVAPTGWVSYAPNTQQVSQQRCTHFGSPPAVQDTNGGFWEPGEFWSGHRLYVPGEVDEVLLKRDPGNSRQPASGSYPLVTKSDWQIGCIPLTLGTGEGFVARSPNGTTYVFDRMVSRASGGLSNTSGTLGRQEIWILASQVTDRFGNWVKYSYDSTDPWRVTAIDANDERHLSFTYQASGAYTVSDGTRTWAYSADGNQITLPDGRKWNYALNKAPTYNGGVQPPHCANGQWWVPPLVSNTLTSTVTHPSGATASFVMDWVRHGVTGILSSANPCPPTGSMYFESGPTPTYETFAIKSKTLAGPGAPGQTWAFNWGAPNGSWDCGPGCTPYQQLTLTAPGGAQTRYTFKNSYAADGEILKVEEGWNGSSALRTTTNTYAATGIATGNSLKAERHLLEENNRPLQRRVISQQGSDFTWTATAFDAYGRVSALTRSGPSGSRSEATAYADNTSLWVLGQVASHTSNGQTETAHSYFTATALLSATSRFGVPQASYSYHGDGSLKTRADGAGHTTTYSDYKRGLPQRVDYPGGIFETAVVSNTGHITSVKGAAGYTTSYGYDAMGRLSSITPPTGFTPTQITFEIVPGVEYGIPAGHWRQTVSQGNARTITYFDALWRPVMVRTFDATSTATEAATRKVTVKGYDAAGRLAFESYPQRKADTYPATGVDRYDITSPGTRTQYDALGRITQVQADSEIGILTTTTSYLSGFKTQTTNPRGKTTTQSHWALDDPAQAQIAGIAAPEGVSVSITRDNFGKPTAITRAGTSINTNAGYTSSVTRRYVYDAGQRLCKTIEPEVGATVQDYDAAGNVKWKAPGQVLSSTTACEQTSVATAAKISYGYDNLNRLKTVGYGDNSPGITNTYTPDGLLETTTSNGSTWTYGYNALRQIATETLSYAGQSYGINWGYNTQGHVSTLTYPNGSTVSYSPNALGEASTVSGYASSISYHPNGAVNAYQLANGIAHELTQNVRGLPWVNSDVNTAGMVLKDEYSYDANGNITAIADQRSSKPEGSSTSRTMTYDDLDRLASTTATGIWGSASYKYDTVDNLRVANVGTRNTAINVNSGTNQLDSVTINGNTTSYLFDTRGNLKSKGTQSFGFDLGNRLTSSPGGNYAYDGLGRRTKINSSDGSTRIQVYSQAGQLLWATSTGGPRPASSTAYIYLAGKQIAETNSVSGTQYAHTDALGSPVAHSTSANPASVINRSRFEPYGYVAQGTKPSANTSVIGFTGHVQDAETDLVYMQQRYYDPIAGRFLSVDPIVTDAATGKLFGRYTYVDNNPYAKIDPDGRESFSLEAVLGFGLGITIGYNRSTTELAITVNAGAGVSGGAQIDPRRDENGRAPLADNTAPATAGIVVNSYGKTGAEVSTPIGTVAAGGKVTAGKDLTTGGKVGGLSTEFGLSKSGALGAKGGMSGGVEVSAYVNVKDAVSAAGNAISNAISKATDAVFSSSAGKQAWEAMQPKIPEDKK